MENEHTKEHNCRLFERVGQYALELVSDLYQHKQLVFNMSPLVIINVVRLEDIHDTFNQINDFSKDLQLGFYITMIKDENVMKFW